jgi:hypothetical protein
LFVLNPTEETTNTTLLPVTLIEKVPASEAVVALFVPFCWIVACGMASPVFDFHRTGYLFGTVQMLQECTIIERTLEKEMELLFSYSVVFGFDTKLAKYAGLCNLN